jgi:glycosyltransferase involved in cell wall biosynthesis
MKITIVAFALGLCGGNRVLFEVANGLIDKGHEVSFVARTPQNWFPLKAPIKVVQDPRQMPEAIPEGDFVVATWCQTAPIVDVVKGRKGIPVYYCQHHETIFFPDPTMKQQVARTYRLPLNLIANSPWLAAILKAEYERESVEIYPGVDQKIFKPATKRKRKKASKKFKVGIFSTKTQFKGLYDTTLPALRYLTRYYNDTEVHIFGADLPIPHKLNVVHHHHLSDSQLAKFYQNIDVYVSGSYAESSPLPHLEAMACGCPVVTTMFGNSHYGEGLMRVIPRAPRTMGKMLLKLALNREVLDKMATVGLHDVKPFTWQRTVDCVDLYFKEMLGDD